MKRKRSEKVHAEDALWLSRIQRIKAEHPAWGYRRVWAYLVYRDQHCVNQKRIYRIMREHRLLATQTTKCKASRVPARSKPTTDKPNDLWGIDMTKIMVPTWGWVYVVVVLDWGSRKIVGYDVAARSRAKDWLRALDRAVQQQFPEGIRGKRLRLVSDNGSQPTSRRFMRDCSLLGIKQIFTSYCNPKGNANTERVIRTMKEDLVWPREWRSFSQLETSLSRWIKEYNEDYPHSSLAYQTPSEWECAYHQKNKPLATPSAEYSPSFQSPHPQEAEGRWGFEKRKYVAVDINPTKGANTLKL